MAPEEASERPTSMQIGGGQGDSPSRTRPKAALPSWF